jgi:hypothetical protein
MLVYLVQQTDGYESIGRPLVFADKAAAVSHITFELHWMWREEHNYHVQDWGLARPELPEIRTSEGRISSPGLNSRSTTYSVPEVYSDFVLYELSVIEGPGREPPPELPVIEHKAEPEFPGAVHDLPTTDTSFRRQIKHLFIGVDRNDPKCVRVFHTKKLRGIRRREKQALRSLFNGG